jgi:hypothetical protein
LQAGDYATGEAFPIIYLSGSWRMLLHRVKRQLGANAVLTCNAATGNDASGNLINPFQTLQGVQNWLLANIDASGYGITINCSGAFTAGLSIGAPIVGLNSIAKLVYNFLGGSTLATATDAIIVNSAGSAVWLQGALTISSSGANALRIFDDANCAIGGITFGATPNGAHVLAAEGARLILAAPYTIAGSAVAHYYVYDQARVRPGALPGGVNNFPVTGNPNFSDGFAVALNLALIATPQENMAFVGNATGPRYLSNWGALIATDGGGPNFFPGSSAGTAPNGGLYN